MTTGFQGFRQIVIYLSLVLSSILVLNFSAFFVCFFFFRENIHSITLMRLGVVHLQFLIIPSRTVLFATHFLSKRTDSRKFSKSV